MARQDLGKIVSEVTSVNVTVDNNVGVPSAEASISGTLTEKELSINFKNLKGEKGDKPTKGTDYYTDQEKQEFITETNALVVAEGKKQVKELQNQGSLSIERLLKIQKEIEAILQNQEAIGNALALNGKSGPQYDKEIRSIAGGEFDSDLLFLNDAGTKTAGKLYYDKNKSGLFKCIQTTTSTVNSTTNFVDVSSLENANKLENLFNNKRVGQFFINENITSQQSIELNLTNIDGLVLLNIPYSYIGGTGSDEISLLLNDNHIAYLPSKETANEHFYCATVFFDKHQGDVVKIKTRNGTLKFEELNITYIVF